MKHDKLTLDLDRIEVVSYATQDAERRGTMEGRDDACPTLSLTATPTGPQ